MKKRRWPIFIIYIVALVVCAVLIYVVPGVMGLFDQTYIAKHGEIEVTNDVDAYIFRDDKVYIADVGGDINRLVEEGDLVKGNSRIVEITGEGKDSVAGKYESVLATLDKNVTVAAGGFADKSGYVSYVLDGYEGIFTTANIDNVSRADIEALGTMSKVNAQSGRCAAGDPVFRIANNGNWYLLTWVDNEYAERFSPGDDVILKAGSEELDANIISIKSGSTLTRIVIRTNTFNIDLLNNRQISVTVVSSNADGIILQSRSIIEKDGVRGVLVRDKVGDNQFKPVRVKADNGTEAAVYSDFFMDDNMEFVETVKVYDEVVTSPTDEEIAAAADVNDKYK